MSDAHGTREPLDDSALEKHYAEELKARKRQAHEDTYPDGCPDWCQDCQRRLVCRDGRHEWPRDYSDGDTCFCGGFYLMANGVDDRPHIIEAKQ